MPRAVLPALPAAAAAPAILPALGHSLKPAIGTCLLQKRLSVPKPRLAERQAAAGSCRLHLTAFTERSSKA